MTAARKNRNTRLLPFGRLDAMRPVMLFQPFLVTAGFVALELEEIVDEHLAEGGGREHRVAFECVERGRQRCRQQRPVGGVGIVVRRGIAPMLDAVEPGRDLRRDIEIRIGGGLADAVLQSGRRIARCAEHAHHHAAVVVAPGGAVGCERVRPVAAIAVDGRRRECRAGRRVAHQPTEIVEAERRQVVNRLLRHEQVAPGLGVDHGFDADASRSHRSS